MPDPGDSREFLLRILVEALNKTKGGLDSVARTTEKFRKDEESAEDAHQAKMDKAREESHKEDLRRLRESIAEESKQRSAASKEQVRRLQKELSDKKRANDEEIRDRKRVEREIEQTVRRRESLERSQARQAINRAKQIGREVEKALDQKGEPSWFQRTQHWFDRNSESVAKLDNQLRGLATLAAIGFAQQLLTVMGALAGAFTAAASSAAFAGTAIGAAMTTAAAQAVPAIGLIVAAFGRVGAVFDAVKQANKAGLSAASDATAGMEAQRNAANRLTEAHEAVVDADRRVVEARRSVNDAIRESRRELEDLADAERAAQQAAEGALNSLDDARRTLRESVQSGDITGGADAELGVRQAQTGLSQAIRDRDRVQADARRTRAGQGGAQEGLRDARRQLEESARAAAKARRGLVEAQHDADVAGSKTAAAATRLNNLLAQLSPAERQLYDALRRLQTRYREAFRPITDILVRSFTRGVDSLSRLVGDPRITKPFTALANSMAASFDRIRGALTSRESVRFFGVMTREASRSQKPIADIAINLFKIFRNVAEAGIPAFRIFLRYLERITGGWAKGTKDRDKLSKFFVEGAHHAIAWLDLAGAVIKLFAALAGAGGAQTGLDLVKDLTQTANDATDSVHNNSEAVRQFFVDSREVMHQIGRVLVAIGKELASSFDPESVKSLADLLITVFIPALGDVVRTLGSLSQILETLITLPVINEFAQFAIALGLGSIALTKFVGIIGLFTGAIGKLGGPLRTLIANLFIADAAGKSAASGIVAAAPSIGVLAAAITGIVGVTALLVRRFGALKTYLILIAGPAAIFRGIVVLLDDKLGILGRSLRAVSSLIRGVIGWLRKFPGADAAFDKLGDALSSIGDLLSSVGNKVRGFISSIGRLGGSQDKSNDIQQKLSRSTKNYRDAVNQARNAVDRLRRAEDNLSRKRLDVRQAAIDVRAAERDLREVRVRARRGRADPDEVAQAEINLKRARLDQKDANRDLHTAEGDLRRERGRSADAISRERRETKKLLELLTQAIVSGDLKQLKSIDTLRLQINRDRRRGGGFTGADVMLSPGEVAVEPSGRSWTVPGAPTAADNFMANVPSGTAILTWSGQVLRSMGASLRDAVAGQLPHFQGGGTVGAYAASRGLQPRVEQIANFIQGRFHPDTIGGYRPQDAYGEHSTGRAIDIMIGRDIAKGNRIASWIYANARQLALKWEIWRQRIRHPGGSWRAMEDRGSPTQNHMDHVHAFFDATSRSLGRLTGGGSGGSGQDRGDSAAPVRTRRVPITGPLFRSVAASTRRGVSALEDARTTVRGGGSLGAFARGVFEDVRGLGGALREDLATRIRVGTRTITTGGSHGPETDRRLGVLDSLSSINRKFKKHYTGQPGETISMGMAQKLARYAQLPSWFPRIWKGESTLMPGIVNSRDGGIGLGQETPSSWGPNWKSTPLGKHMMQLGGYEAMRNPVKQALMNRFHLAHAPSKTPNTRGFPWFGTRYLRGGGWVGPQRFQNGGMATAARAGADPVDEVLRAFRMVGRTTTSFVGRTLSKSRNLARAINLFFADTVGEGGFFDDFTARLEALRADFTNGIQRATFRLSKAGRLIRRRLSPEAIAGRELGQLQAEYRLLLGERGALATQLRDARIAFRKAGRNRAAQRAARRVINNVLGRIRDVNTAIGDTVNSIGEATEQALSALVERINSVASHGLAGLNARMSQLDIQGRVADIREAAGDTAGAFAMRGQILAERGRTLVQQRPVLLSQQRALQGAFQTAVNQGNTEVAKDLYDQLGEVAVALSENSVAVAENSAAIKANVSAERAARVERIIGRGGFLTGVFGSLGGLLEAAASATGTNVDIAHQKSLIEQTVAVLTGTGAGLRVDLFKWLGIDLRGLDPVSLAERLKNLNFDKIEAGLSEFDRGEFEKLINSIIENATAVQQNTDSLKQLSSNTTQGFTSTAWTWFRNAIFNGAGGLLPQFQIPSAQAGAMITSSGMLLVHEGERVVPARVTSGGSGGVEANVYVTEQVQDADADVMANRLGHRLKHGSK